MSGGCENQDFSALKKLLTSWDVGILYQLFKEEDINIDELKMMQLSHSYALLKNYKMGVKIRFEHHLNSWRNKIGIPLKRVDFCCCNYRSSIENSSIDHHSVQKTTTKPNNAANIITKRRKLNQDVVATYQDQLNEHQLSLSPQSANSSQSLANMLNFNEITNFMPATFLGSPNEKTHNTDDEIKMENLPLNSYSDILSDSTYEPPPKFPSKSTLEKCPVTLKQILQMSGAFGMSVVKFYKEKNRLTKIQRSQLIQTIVDFFYENDYHLSLNMSHNLEWEILKMFPTEKLEYYRTEKRGKIYVKFSNMKCYKRERCNKEKTDSKMVIARSRRSQHNNERNGETMETKEANNGENGCVEPEVLIKEENISDKEKQFLRK